MTALVLACALPVGDDVGPDPVDTDTTDTTDIEADDARVRALTDLPEGDVACAEPVLARVDWTVDGDTFYASPEDGGEQLNVRVIGVDTPEVEHDDPAECYGDEAWDWAEAQLEGRLVWLTFDAECEDVYGRTLAYVFRGDDEDGFFERALLRNGYAETLTIAPNDTYEDAFRDDERAARDEGLGLWSACR